MQEQQIQHSHSPKTLQTIELMGTSPADWGIVNYTVRAEVRNLSLPVQCPSCYGKGIAYSQFTDGEETLVAHVLYARYDEQVKADYPHIMDYSRRDAFFQGEWVNGSRSEPLMHQYGWVKVHMPKWGGMACPQCPLSRNGRKGTGIVFESFTDVPVNAHYPAWPAGTQFTSRFPRGAGGCEACGKCGIKSGEYAVAAQRADGVWVGMFVGNACLQKFGFKKFKTIDEDAKQWNLSEGTNGLFKPSNKKNANPLVERVFNFYYRSREAVGASLEVKTPEVVEEPEVIADEVVEVKEIQVVSKGFDCPHCSKTFGSRQGRYNHIRKHHA